MAKATFAAGCFWGIEQIFQHMPGILSTQVGYTGGRSSNPTYEQVCSHTTGHAEAIEIIFDPEIISYDRLLKFFWQSHDATDQNRQGINHDYQYRSAVFYHDEQQKEIALQLKRQLEAKDKLLKLLVNDIVPATIFYPAEAYHQQYYEKHAIPYLKKKEL